MTNSPYIYLDNNATTPCDPAVVEKMRPFFTDSYGNPSNGFHILGRMAGRAVEEAREQVADLIHASSKEIVFTSGATESDNLAILGYARGNCGSGRKRIVTGQIEHKAVLNACHKLESEDFEVVYIPALPNGVINLEAARNAITDQTSLVSVQAANNEIGTIQPVQKLVDLAHQHGAVFHSDAAQAVGKIPVDVGELGIDLMSISAHKLYGPKGVGGLYIRGGSRAIFLEPLNSGGVRNLGFILEQPMSPGSLVLAKRAKFNRGLA